MPRWFTAVALLALALRGLLWWQFIGSPFSRFMAADEAHYWHWAGKIASGIWRPEGVFYQGPFYPYVLAFLKILLPDLRAPGLAALQLAANWLTCLLFLPLLRRRAGEAVAFAAATLALFFAPAAFFALKVMPTTMGILFVMAGLTVLPQAGDPWRLRCALAGIALGLAVLSVPSAVLVVGASCLYLLVRPPVPRRRAPAAGFLLVTLLSIAPATLSNYLADGSLILVSADFGLVFLQGNNPLAKGWYTKVEGIAATMPEEEREAAELARRETGRALNTQQVSYHFFAKGLRFIRDDPAGWLRLAGRRAVLLVGGMDVPHEFSMARERRDFLPALFALPVGGTIVMLLAPLGLLLPETRKQLLLPCLAALALGAVYLLFYISNRFVWPFHFLLLPAAAAALTNLRALRARPHRALAMLPVAAATLLSIKPLADTRWEVEDYLPKLALAQDEAGDVQGQVRTFERMVALAPTSPVVYEFIAGAYRKYGDTEYALWAYDRALSLDPRGRNPRFHRATLLWTMGRTDEALSELDWLLAANPADEEARATRDTFLRNLGR